MVLLGFSVAEILSVVYSVLHRLLGHSSIGLWVRGDRYTLH